MRNICKSSNVHYVLLFKECTFNVIYEIYRLMKWGVKYEYKKVEKLVCGCIIIIVSGSWYRIHDG